MSLEIQDFFIEIGVPLKSELRKARAASETRAVLEGEITALILRLGVDGRYVSPEAAKLHQHLFGTLHPRTYTFGVEATKTLMRNLVEKNPSIYGSPYTKPLTLKLMEDVDAVSGTAYSTRVREMYLRVASYSAVFDGQVTAKMQAILDNVKSVLMDGANLEHLSRES